MRLIASSATRAGILALVNEFYATNAYTLGEDLSLHHPTHIPPSAVRIVKKNRRYRFEALRTQS